MDITISNQALETAAAQGADTFLDAVTEAIYAAVDHQLNAESMAKLSPEQTSLLAYRELREEVMDGGFVQLIHNGWGPFFFFNPFARVMKMWGLHNLGKLIHTGRKLYLKSKEQLEAEMTDDEFMALFEQHPEFDDLDDEFVENEELWTNQLAEYVDEHLDSFIRVVQ